MSNKLPSFQFYIGDWTKDPNLKRCSHASKGVWMDMLCLAFECDDRGVLATAGVPWTIEEIACAVGGNTDVTVRCIQELVDKRVAKVREEDGALYSKRMVEDEKDRASNRERQSKHREKGKEQEGNEDVTDVSQKSNAPVTPPSHRSSSSSSSSLYPPESDELGLAERLLGKIRERNPKHKQPNLQAWAKSIDLMIRVDERTVAEIRDVIDWCQADPFWQDNILSGEKLRAQYDQLKLKMGKQHRPKQSAKEGWEPAGIWAPHPNTVGKAQ